MKHPRGRRAAGLLAAGALIGSALAASPLSSARAAEEVDPSPATAGAEWLAGELTDGLLNNPNFGGFDDYGLSIDAGLALDDVGGQESAVQSIADAIADNLDSYTTYAVTDTKTHVSAGAIAKALAFAQVAGRDGAAYGGQNLVTQLEGRVSSEAGTRGRIQDVFFPEEQFESDFSNTIGQAFAAQGLDTAASALTGDVTDYLLDQQCSEGFFRLSFAAADAADQTCDGDPDAEASTDATGIALLALRSQVGDLGDGTDVDAAVLDGLEWLASTQGADGSFGSDGQITAPNTNSTGLAGSALGAYNQDERAQRAATYVRSLQADDPAACATALTATPGAIAYDPASQATGRTAGITDDSVDQFRRATTQALPALAYAPAFAADPVDVRGGAQFVRDRSVVRVGLGFQAPGDTVCFKRGAVQSLTAADTAGRAITTVRLPAGTGVRRYSAVTSEGVRDTLTFSALAKKELGLKTKSRVERGTQQRAEVSGLVAGERIVVRYGKQRVARTVADGAGKATVRFKVGTSAGRKKVVVIGRFADRRASDFFRVTR